VIEVPLLTLLGPPLPAYGCQTDRMTESTGDAGSAAASQPEQRLAESQRLAEEARRLREVPELDLIAFSAGQNGPLHAAGLNRRTIVAIDALRSDLARLRTAIVILGVIIIALLALQLFR
jgi:hypothetical protein